ncbi:MAG: alpha-2-macroglobulin family protein, partial [Rikenellaceae bacterium]
MKRRFLSLILFAYIAMQISYAQDNYQSFAKQWDEIKLHIKNNSYKQASDVANDIFVKSVEQDNQFEILRSFLSYLDCRRRVDWNENDILRDSLFKMSHLFTHPDVRILYEYSKLRNLFLSTSSGSGVRSDYLTLPVSQWNISEHVKSFKSLFGQILSDCDNFSHTPVKPYLAIFEKRDNSQYYEECSLGDYIKYCLIRTYRNNTTISATIDSLYASVLDQHVDNPELYIPMFVDFKKYDAPQTYYSDVDQIVAKYSAHPYVALAIADKLEMKSKDFFDKNNESHYQQIWDECNKTIAKYPDSKAVEKLEKIKETISRSYARFTIYPQYQPDTDCLFSVNHKNIDQFNLKVYRLNNPEKIDRYNTPLHVHSIDTYIEDATLVYSKKYKVSSPLNINKVEEFKFKGNKYGEYIAVFTDRDGICSGVDRFYVSDISAIFRTIDSKKQLYVADYTTGVPYSKVGLKITSNEKINSISRDENIDLDGFTTYMSAQQPAVLVDVRPYLDSDTYAAPNTISLSPISDTRAQDYRIVVNTDRRRYNFNDTIRLRAYVYTEGLDGAMLKGIKHSFKLLSGDGKLVYETPLLESDEWGGFDGYFIVSDAWMGGSYRIAVNREDRAFSWLYGSVVVNVDDFKKPKFDISLDNSVRVLKFGEKASIVGQISTFGGFDTQDIDVRYEISNRELRENIIAKGEVRSDKDGKFVIEFDVEPSKKLAQTIKFYNVSVTATDKQGETHSQSNYRIITNYPYTIDFDFPNFFAKEDGIQPKIKIVNQTSSKDCETSGTYTILKGDKPLISGQFESEQPLDVDWSVLMSGEYEFKASVEGAVDKVSKFVVFSLYDKTYPADYDLFVYQKESEFGADTPIEFVLGTKAKKLHAVVELLAPSGETLFAENMIFEKGMDCYQLPYKDSYPQSVHLYISAIYNGQSFVFNREYKRNAIDRNLNVTFISLRDKREPKEREEFIVKVTDSDGAAVRANILLTAYNLASDAPYTHTLSGPVNFANNLRKIEYDRSANSRLNIFGNANSQLFSTSEYITINGSTNSNAPLHYMVGGGTPQSENSNVREDFRSTVAFMSDLTTDENGEAKVSFTYPDAITTYKIIALAVAKDTRSSIKEAEVVVSRDVMISALLPQFFRVGDVVNVKAEVINKTSSPISGSVNFSAKGAAIISGGVQKVELAANSTSLIEFSIAANGVEGSIELTKEFIVGNHKDIEINKIPVSQGVGEKIENRKFIIDSKSKKIKFDLLDLVGSQSSDKSSEELVVAVANPIDMLLTSMAGVVQEESKSVLITLNNWYVSGVGSQMAYQYRDRINALHDENINSGNNQRSFGSRDEISTPWKTLSSLEITQRLSELSRPGQVVQEQQHRVERIIAMQNKDGGFPWYSSMPSSTMVTMLMLDKHSQLVELGHYDGIESYDGATLEMFNKAV